MDRDRVINWAENARYHAQPSEFPDIEILMTPPDLLRFAALVAAHEREQCALVCESLGEAPSVRGVTFTYAVDQSECAAAIRARSA